MKITQWFVRLFGRRPTSAASNVPQEVDWLTGLRSSSALASDTAAAFDSALERREPLAFAVADLDGFKSVNDEHGHEVGDELLIEMAELLRRATRQKGSAYRCGGEEFVLLLPNYTALEAYALAERVRYETQQTPLSSRQVQVTVSFGISSSGGVEDAEQLFLGADRALYEAKSLGGNCVRVFGQDADSEGGSLSPVREPGSNGLRFGPRSSTAWPT